MTLTPLASRSPAAVRNALVRRGMDEHHAAAAAQGLHPVALIVDSLTSHERDAVVESAHRQGIECLSGDSWALLAGATARLAGLTRPGFAAVPPNVADELGQLLQRVVEPPAQWLTARGAVALDRPIVVGILNVTPDSFSDGGRYLEPAAALRHAETMIGQGAGVLDVGGESARPGRPDPVPAEEEWRRLAPVLEELTRWHPALPIIVDTVKADVAERALEAGVWAINDVSGLRFDPRIADVCAAHGGSLVLMHSRGSFPEMATYDHAFYDDVVAELIRELTAAVETAVSRSVASARLVLDPGLGFAKTPEQSFAALAGLPALSAFGMPIMVGPSRKRFLGTVTGKHVADRDGATASACVAAFMLGANLFRVHAVGVVREALDVASAVRTA